LVSEEHVEDIMSRIRSFLPAAAIMVLAISLFAEESRDRTNSEAAFSQLTALAGEWDAIQDGTPVRETYTVTANGSALLVETNPASKTAMITMITVDGDRLIATHYCAAGKNRSGTNMSTDLPTISARVYPTSRSVSALTSTIVPALPTATMAAGAASMSVAMRPFTGWRVLSCLLRHKPGDFFARFAAILESHSAR
jgi:hypothetical protein